MGSRTKSGAMCGGENRDSDSDHDATPAMNRALFPVTYSPDFEAFWKAYGPVPNSSKSDAFKAWQQTKGSRPEMQVLIGCVDLANTWLFEETMRRNGRGKAPKPHAATWLRQHRWDTWAEQASKMIEGAKEITFITRKSFKADTDHPDDPSFHTKKRSIKDILEERRSEK